MQAAELRKQVLKQLKSLEKNTPARQAQEVALRESFLRHLSASEHVAVFRALSEEVPLDSFLPKGRAFYFPKILDSAQGLLEFRQARLADAQAWEQGPYGIWEPTSSCPLLSVRELKQIWVPGVAFSRAGARLGRGKGFYDRVLSQAQNAQRASLLFREQLVDHVPVEAWDQGVHLILTPDEELSITSFSAVNE